MKIGIAYKTGPSVFGSGKGQAVLGIAEVCLKAGHEVVLIQEGNWWPELQGLESNYTIVPPSTDRVCDVFLDIDGLTDPDIRSAMGHQVIVFFRSDPSLEYLEKAAYMSQDAPYSLQGVTEVWVWDWIGSERIPLLETMLENLPVRRLPYVWTPRILEHYLATESVKPVKPAEGWTIVISEKNTTVTSGCLIPLLGAAKATSTNEILLCNAKELATNPFFQDNLVKAGLSFKSSKIHYEGRLRYADLVGESSCLLVSHVRHIPFRPGLLDILWLGLPLIHNCEALKSLGTYYAGEDVDRLATLIDSFSIETDRDAQAFIAEHWSVEKGLDGWSAVFQSIGSVSHTPCLRITFTDMWEGFDPVDNFFLDLVRSVTTDYEVIGSGSSKQCDLVICGPFGSTWQQFEGTRKVYYSGEPPLQGECEDSRIDLFLTHSPLENSRQLRLPMWALFVEWFGLTPSAARNPNRLPKDYALKPASDPKTEFCAFVVSNPLSKERNEAFDQVNAYKKVNSGGAYKNNIGGALHALYGGGGGGDSAKFEFLKKHQFCICYENSVASGYVTEKLLHAKMAGCIPLYRGASEAVQDFNPNGFVHVKDGQDVVQLVQDLEADPERLALMAATPALDSVRYTAIQESLERIGRRLVQLATAKPLAPRNEIVQPLLQEASLTGKAPLFVSFATAKYLPSLLTAIQSVKALQAKDPGIRMRVYLGSDVSDGVLEPWVEVRRLGQEPFEGMFEPAMFGWKLWLLHDLCHDPDLEGDPVLYADAGALWLHVPQDMLTVVQQSGLCLIKDRSQINRHWCSNSMVKEMGVTASELEMHQLLAGFIGFQAGHSRSIRLFDEALKWGSKKSCLFGPYLAGVDAQGHPIGHRHDQSILSILAIRQQVPMLDSTRFVCDTTLRKAYQKSTPVYLHRGQPINHKQVLPGIDDVWVISLDRRPDRWQSLMLSHPSLLPIANRLPGIDGRELQLTPRIASLFANNDFKWKKSVTGCALSHILAWAQLASEHPSVQNYLILEDDCRFVKQGLGEVTSYDNGNGKTIISKKEAWMQQVADVVAEAPPDAELLMLGGVLPGNLEAYPHILDSVNNTWATIRPNTLFTGTRSIPFFHFCAYSYILTKTGAKKLMTALQTKGVYTSIDHYLIHPDQGLKMYALKDLITTCFQADNPVYKTAAFDEFLRVDSYDSDIWNNKECFENGSSLVTGSPSLWPALVDVLSQSLWPALVDVLSQAPHSIQTRNTLRPEAITIHTPSTVYYYPDGAFKQDATLEESWLKSLWPTVQYQPFPGLEALPSDAWLLVARPALEFWQEVCKGLNAKGKPFRVLHLSDELCSDPIEFYNLPMCTKVLRNYARSHLDEKVVVMPLGWAQGPPSSIPSFSGRPYVWGFHGSSWGHREALLQPLQTIHPNFCKFITEFQSKDKTKAYEYQQMLLQSQCVPIPPGQNAETFRLYEALEHGAIPLYVRSEGDSVYWLWLRTHLHLLEIQTWDKVPAILELFRKNPEKAEQYRMGLLTEWAKWKGECKTYFP